MNHLNRIAGICLLSALLLGSVTANAQQLEFSLTDSYGRTISSQDYVGVPIFLEFGACW